MASRRLFAKYTTLEEIANASIREIERLIRPAGFFRAKARYIRQTSSILVERFGGDVPSTMEELLSLPGVGQKTANCVLAYGFGIPALPVDVHVHRISNRIGIVSTRSPHQTEEVLKSIFPEESWSEISFLLIQFGREICLPRIPRCTQCDLRELCKYAETFGEK